MVSKFFDVLFGFRRCEIRSCDLFPFNFYICLINERNNKTNNINSEETSAKKTDQIAIGYSVTWDLILIGINGMREMAWIGPASFSI